MRNSGGTEFASGRDVARITSELEEDALYNGG
jgi:hypothetical protein